MASIASCNPNITEAHLNVSELCGCREPERLEGGFFRGVFIAVPAGLVMWYGILRVVTEVVHRF